jgi:APA family basic amino acid/polyamine antiporter
MTPPAAGAQVNLRRELGLRDALSVGVGGTIGGGIFVLVGLAARDAGPAALLSFGLAFVVAALIALPYAELACRLPVAGGGYAYARRALGESWGFVMGWIYWGGYVLASGYITIGFGGYLHAATGLPTAAGAVALVAACVAVNLVGVKVSGRAQAFVVAAAVACFAAFGAWGLAHIQPATLTPFAPHGALGVLAAAPVVFLAFGGFDMIAAAGEEIRRPERNLPLAILLTLACVLVLYLLVALVAFGTTPAHTLGSSAAPLAEAAYRFGGSAARGLVLVCALLTLAATANAVLMATSRVTFAMARDGLLPGALKSTSSKTSTPRLAVLVNGVLLGCVALGGNLALAAEAGGFLYVMHFLPPLIALVRLRRDPSTLAPSFRTPVFWLVVPLAFASSIVLIVATGRTGAAVGLSWLALGAIVYGAYRFARARARGRAATGSDGRGPSSG